MDVRRPTLTPISAQIAVIIKALLTRAGRLIDSSSRLICLERLSDMTVDLLCDGGPDYASSPFYCDPKKKPAFSTRACARPALRDDKDMNNSLVGRGSSRLAHGWRLMDSPEVPREILLEFIRPAVRAVPSSMARRLGSCRISLLPLAHPDVTSQWTETDVGLEVCVTTSGLEEHDAAMELLLCLGQALWGRLSANELQTYWTLLDRKRLSNPSVHAAESMVDWESGRARAGCTSQAPPEPCRSRAVGGGV